MFRLFYVPFLFILTLFLSGCFNERATEVRFIVKFKGSILPCDQSLNVMWYLSNFRSENLIDIEGDKFTDGKVVLLGADCSKQAWKINLNSNIEGKPLYFDLGVPFSLNHQNPLTSAPPLNVSEMFWSWQLGHKFLRFDGENTFAFHLGSTGCKSQSRLRSPIAECQFPNRFSFKIVQFDPKRPVIFDLDRLFMNVTFDKSCMSEQRNPVCQKLFANLGTEVFYQE